MLYKAKRNPLFLALGQEGGGKGVCHPSLPFCSLSKKKLPFSKCIVSIDGLEMMGKKIINEKIKNAYGSAFLLP